MLNSLAGMAAKRIFSVSVMKPEKKGKNVLKNLKNLNSFRVVFLLLLLLGFLKVDGNEK